MNAGVDAIRPSVDMGLGAAVNPVFFPKILLGFWLVFTGIIALQLFWPGSNRQSEPGNGAARIWPAFAAIALCLLAICIGAGLYLSQQSLQ